MQVPRILLGKLKEVKSETKKMVTRLLKGQSIDSFFSEIECIETEDWPKALFWLDRSWSQFGEQDHFPLCVVHDVFFSDTRISKEAKQVMHAELLRFFSQTPWGTIILNNSQGYSWIHSPEIDSFGYGQNPDYAAKILEGTCRFWDVYSEMGEKFYRGGYNPAKFHACQPLSYGILARCGIDTSEFPIDKIEGYPSPPARGNIKMICEKYGVIDKLNNDDIFREKVKNGSLRSK